MRRAVQDGRRLLHQVGGRLLRRRRRRHRRRGRRCRRRRGRGEVVVGGRGERRQRGRRGGVGQPVADAALAPDARVPVAADNVGVVVLKVGKKWILE